MSELLLGKGVYYQVDSPKPRVFVAEPVGTPALIRALAGSPIPYRESLISACQYTQPEIVSLLTHGGVLSTTGDFLTLDLADMVRRSPTQYEWVQEGLENLQKIRGFQKISGAWRPYLLAGEQSKGTLYLVDPSLRRHLSTETHYNGLSRHMVVTIGHDNLDLRRWDHRRGGILVSGSNEPAVMSAFFGLADMNLLAEEIVYSPLSPKDIARQAVIDVLEAQRTVPATNIQAHLSKLMEGVA